MKRSAFSRLRRPGVNQQIESKLFLIVCEGEKTEVGYFAALCKLLNLTKRQVDVLHPEGTDPMTLVESAIARRDHRKQESRSSPDKSEYDEIWVICDLEKKHDERRTSFAKARELAKKENINLAPSDPCFEYWLILHEQYTTKHFSDANATTKYLKKLWPAYRKNFSFTDEIMGKIPQSVEHARQCRRYHQDTAVKGDDNPSTEVDCPVVALNQTARVTHRLSIKD